jgi:hypothetical protein
MEENNKNKNIKEIVASLVRVENMQSSRRNDIPNQFIIKGDGFTLFQSYNSPIAMLKDGKTYIFKDWDYSNTTGKYRNQFLGETKKETLEKLKSGEYIAVDFEI